jgi:DNA polymerase
MANPLEPFACSSGPQNAKMVLIGEAWGEEEAKHQLPFIGASGKELFKILGEAMPEAEPKLHANALANQYSPSWPYLRELWLNKVGILLTNVFCLRPPDNKIDELLGPEVEAIAGLPAYTRGKYFRNEFAGHYKRLMAELMAVRPNLIVCLGNTPMWAIMGIGSGISARRGAIAPAQTPMGMKCLPTFHPAAIMRNWSWRPILLSDLMKAQGEALFPEIRRIKRKILVHPTLQEIENWTKANLGDRLMAVDIETNSGLITDIGFATRIDYALTITFRGTEFPEGSFWANDYSELRAWQFVDKILSGPNPKLFHNGLYDLQYLAKMGFKPRNVAEDTMLLHHALFPEMQKSLGFLGSIYTNEVAWKLMRIKSKGEDLKKDE